MNQVIDAFFKPQAPFNPSTVSTPPPIHPGRPLGEPFTLAPEKHRGPLADTVPLPLPADPMAKLTGTLQSKSTQYVPVSVPKSVPDKKATKLLWDLEAAVKQIPSKTPSATPEHQLNIFSVDPYTCIAEPGEDDWLIINQMMKMLFGWGEQEMAAVIPNLLNCGTYGLDSFIHFMTFFALERGLQGALFETKVEAILKGIEDQCAEYAFGGSCQTVLTCT